jgi:hypothetical protein
MTQSQDLFCADMELRSFRLMDGDGIKKHFIETLIEKSVWWLSHPCGTPVRAPGHAKHIYGGQGRWSLDFGANTVNLTKAVCQARTSLLRWAQSVPSVPPDAAAWSELRNMFARAIRGSVKNYQSDYYFSYGTSELMTFGVTAINVSDFVKALGGLLTLREIELGHADDSSRGFSRAAISPPVNTREPKGPVVPCQLCGAVVRTNRYQKHLDERCPKRIVAPPGA